MGIRQPCGIVLAAAFALAIASISQADTFTYQGRLTEAGAPVQGPVNLAFRLYDAASAGNQIGTELVLTNFTGFDEDGRVTVDLDFGAAAFTGDARWLEVWVDGAPLSPRQPIHPTPYAMYAQNVVTGAVPFVYSGADAVFTDGNVGIGTTTPLAGLHMYGSQPTIRLEHSAGDSYAEFKDGSTQQLRINKVNNSGGVLLDLNPKATNGTSNAQVRFFRETDTTGPKYVQFLRGNFSTAESARIGVDGANSFFQAHGGNFGIRTNSPEANLHIDGGGSSAVGFRIDQPGSSTGYISMGSPLGHTAIAAAANNGRRRDIRFTNSGLALSVGSDGSSPPTGNGLFVHESGNVGIGTTSPNYDLQVVGDGSQSTMRITNGGTSSTQTNTGLIIGDVVNSGRAISLYGITTNDLLDVQNDGGGNAASIAGNDGHAVEVINGGSGNGVDVTESGGGVAVRAINNASSGSAYGVFAYSASTSGIGSYGQGKLGVYGFSGTGGFDSKGVYGVSSSADGVGVHGHASNGSDSAGVWGTNSGGGWAGFFSGDVRVTGDFLVSGSKNFMIDNPLNPTEEYLYHSCVESDEMKNVYDGVATLDAFGEAIVSLPDWFDAVNGDFRYQLTCIGGYAPVYIAQEIADNTFTIAGGSAGLKVSWQVTGVRIDPVAQAANYSAVRPKPERHRGTYLNPEAYGQPVELAERTISIPPSQTPEEIHP